MSLGTSFFLVERGGSGEKGPWHLWSPAQPCPLPWLWNVSLCPHQISIFQKEAWQCKQRKMNKIPQEQRHGGVCSAQGIETAEQAENTAPSIHSSRGLAKLSCYFQFKLIQALSLSQVESLPLPGSVYLCCHCSVTKSCLTLQPHGLQHTRLPSPSPSPRVCSDSCALSRWCHPNISSAPITQQHPPLEREMLKWVQRSCYLELFKEAQLKLRKSSFCFESGSIGATTQMLSLECFRHSFISSV